MVFPGFAVTENGTTDRTSPIFTVQNTTTTQIAVDTNGDGSIVQIMTRTWSELASLICGAYRGPHNPAGATRS